MRNLAKTKLPIIILIQAMLLLLIAGIFALATNYDVYASALSGSSGVSDAPPTELEDLQSADSNQLSFWADNLQKFDGRDFGYITPEGNQGSLGICWAYAAVGAVEANILRDSVDPEATKDTLNLDEMIAAYARFNRDGENDPLYLTTNDAYSSDTWKSSGDFADNAFMSMTQGYSLVNQVSNQNWSDWALKQRLSPSRYFVQGIKQIDHTKEAIKRAILEYGGVTMEYKAPETMYQTYVHHASNGAGHASLIIGWDDNVSSSLFWPDTPSSNGAWIVKNSWGYGGDKGVNGTCCFYLSYEAYMTDNLFVVDMALSENYQNIYYYDGAISEDPSQYYADAYGAIYEAKLSTADRQEQLSAVSFGIKNSQATVDIEIYKLNAANFGNVNDEVNIPDSGVLLAKKQVYFEDDGFYTVDLDKPIALEQGEIFSIVIRGQDSKGGFLNPYLALDYVDSINDMTYRKYMDEWTSFKGYKNTYPGSSPGSCVRLRAITNVVKTQESFDNDLRYARMELSSKFTFYKKDTPQRPDLTVYYGDKILQEGEDYEVYYLDNLKPGTVTVKICGIDNYYGEQSTTFEIAKPKYPPGVINERIEVYSDTYRLSQVPVPEGWRWSESQDIVLVMGDSGFGYQMKYMGDDADCYQSITCSVKIFKNNFLRPAQVDITGSSVVIDGKYTYSGMQIQPSVRVVCKGHELKWDKDYTLEYQNNINVGVATVVIKGRGEYTGQIQKQFDIKKAKWPDKKPKSTIYVGKDVKKLSQISLNCAGWSWQDDLEISSDNFQATAIYIGAGMNNYANTKMIVTIIRESETGQKNIASIAELRLEQTEYEYDGQLKMPNVIARDGGTTLLKGNDFTVEYKNNETVGQASVVVKGINKFMGAKTLYFTITRADRHNFKVVQPGWKYGEDAPAPSVEGQFEESTVTYSYSDLEYGVYTEIVPTKAGDYWIKATIAQSQNYNEAEARAPFVIAKADMPNIMPNAMMTIDRKTKILRDVALDYAGWKWEAPQTKIEAETTKVWAVYDDRENYETYRIEIALIKEAPIDVSKLSVNLEVEEFIYDGIEKTPKIIAKDGGLTLVVGVDYDVKYAQNKFAGIGKAVVIFKNDYSGTKELDFTILQAEKPTVDTTIHCDKKVEKLSDIQLPNGFVWDNENVKVSGNKMIANAVYVGDDAASYKNTRLTFEIFIDAQDQVDITSDSKKENFVWLAIVIPIAVLSIAGVLIAIAASRRKNHRKKSF